MDSARAKANTRGQMVAAMMGHTRVMPGMVRAP